MPQTHPEMRGKEALHYNAQMIVVILTFVWPPGVYSEQKRNAVSTPRSRPSAIMPRKYQIIRETAGCEPPHLAFYADAAPPSPRKTDWPIAISTHK